MDGIAGIYSPNDSGLVDKVLFEIGLEQHRGKESSGVAIGNGKGTYIRKELCGIDSLMDDDMKRAFSDLGPVAAIANVGYTKSRIAERRNAEPIRVKTKTSTKYEVVLTMDGDVLRENSLKAELEDDYQFRTGNITEVVGALLHKYITEEGISFEAGRRLVDKLHGRATFALVAFVYDGKETYMITLNDDRAFEPFCYGNVDGAFVVASESVSHERLGGRMEREFNGAEMAICSREGIEKKRVRDDAVIMPDIFQAIYYGHPSSMFRGKEILQIRRELGRELVDHYKTSCADIVVPIPESGWGVSLGLEDRLGIKIPPALVKNARAVRTFPERDAKAKAMFKFAGIRSLIEGLKIAAGDDSIVKGSVTEGGAVWWLRHSGAKYIELWVSYGPMFFPSFKEWHRGRICIEELAVQRAFEGDNPYDKGIDEINRAVANLSGVDAVMYNLQEIIERVAGQGSFQALDASYPISEEFWPGWLKAEVERFHRSRTA